MSEDVKHAEARTTYPDGTVESQCQCGERWTHPRSRSTEVMDSIFQSHLSYAKRLATRVD